MYLTLGCLLDSGADLSYAHNSLLDILEPTLLVPEVNQTHIGVTGEETVTFERIGLNLLDREGNTHYHAFRVTNNNLGEEPITPVPYIQEVCKQVGIPQELRHNFNL